ncbi:MAG TPA: thioesterase family protein [Ignavibacteriaceae bacterium]|nr:thioesterase family protein [Ignavibacteriaceae bacterium]
MSFNNLFIITTKIDVKPYDIDAAGHVNNTVYVRWLEDLRIRLFENFLPINELLKNNQHLVVTSTTINYKKKISLSDSPVASMRLIRFDRVIWVLNAEFRVNDSLAVFAEQKCVVVNLLTNKIQKPPVGLVEKIIYDRK